MKKRILLVEDDADFREAFARLVEEALSPGQLDVAFVEAGSVAEARSRLGEGGLDAALIDVVLPDGNGLDLVREINDGGVGDRQPTLVLTANLGTFVAARAMEAGARGCSTHRSGSSVKTHFLKPRKAEVRRSHPCHPPGDREPEAIFALHRLVLYWRAP
jgi:CheY-like chemotaxis protein